VAGCKSQWYFEPAELHTLPELGLKTLDLDYNDQEGLTITEINFGSGQGQEHTRCSAPLKMTQKVKKVLAVKAKLQTRLAANSRWPNEVASDIEPRR